MKIAYMMLVHKNIEQVSLLINSLVDDDIDLYIHVDKKNDSLYKELLQLFGKDQRIHVLTDRVDVKWGGISMIQATLNLMYAVSKKKYDFISLISGQDFPIKPLNELKAYLEKNAGVNFLEYEEMKDNAWRLKCYNLFMEHPHNRRTYIRVIDNILRRIQKVFIKRRNFKGLRLYKGSQWFTITQDALDYILRYLDENSDYLEDYRYTACSDESFFHIILLNSKYKDNCMNSDLTYIDWENAVGGSPPVLLLKDYDQLKDCEDFFARKFDLDVDAEIVSKLANTL